MGLKVWLPLNGDLTNNGTENLTITNTDATVNANGKIGSCYYFNGTSARISCSSVTYSYPITMCAWIKGETITASGTEYILSYNTATGGTTGHNIGIGTYSGKLSIWHGGSYYSYSQPLSNNIWYHVAAVVTENSFQLYLNGSQIIMGTGTQTDVNSSWLTFGARSNSSTGGTGGASYYFKGYMNDIRVYNHALSAAEVKEISQGLVLHYKLDGNDIPNINLGKTSADYSNQTQNTPLNAGSWGGDTGTVTYYSSGGYAGLPYKHYHKTAAGTGGIYGKTGNDIEIESGITYTMSCWIKADIQFTASSYSFNINRGVGNRYITYGSNFTIYTDWHYYTKTFTATEDDAGLYGEMSIIYYDDVVDFNIYYSGFKIEKGTVATQWTPPDVTYTIIQDSSGYNHNGSILNTVNLSNDSPRYNISTNLVAGNSAINCGRGAMVTDSITVNLWLKSSAWANPISCTEGGGWNFEASGDYFRFPIYISGVGYKYGQSTHTKAQICNNEWHMLTGIYDRLNQKVKIYVDGELDNEYAAETSNIIGYNSTNVIWLGAEASSSATTIASNGMIGLFSDLRIYATPLLDNDIKSLYNVGMKIDNLSNVHAFEFDEEDNDVLAGIPWTSPYSTHSTTQNLFTNYNSNGEPQFTANSTGAGTQYIQITPGVYYYDTTISVNAGNQFYIGFERYDADKTSRSNQACVYIYGTKPSSDVVKQRYKGTIDLSTDSVNPLKYITLRVLNGWSGTNSGVTGQATIHHLSLRLVSGAQNPKLEKTGQFITSELKEMGKSSLYQNRLVEAAEFIER